MGARMAAEVVLPPPGRWALGSDAQAGAEALVLAAQRAGLRTGWLSAEAGFLSNLTIDENLRLMHDWGRGERETFEAALARAQAVLGIDVADFLPSRPSQLRGAELLRARLLRLVLLRPALVVLSPALLAQAGQLAEVLLTALAGARLLLLTEPAGEWPAWPPVANVGAGVEAGADAEAGAGAGTGIRTAASRAGEASVAKSAEASPAAFPEDQDPSP